jgi:hypothetical protein
VPVEEGVQFVEGEIERPGEGVAVLGAYVATGLPAGHGGAGHPQVDCEAFLREPLSLASLDQRIASLDHQLTVVIAHDARLLLTYTI